MINKKHMMDCVYNQLAIDYNCSPEDFKKDGIIFTQAIKSEGRRPMPWTTPRLEIVTTGNSVIVNASESILPCIRKQLAGKTRFEVFCQPEVYGINPYFLPNVDKIKPIDMPNEFEYSFVEKNDVHKLYEVEGFHNALQYNDNSQRPDVLVAVAKSKGEIIGMAGASDDCKTMWQIGVDVLPSYRGNGVAAALVNMLTLEILERGYIPYYSTDCSNVASQHVAVKAGFVPAWAHCYKTRGLRKLKLKSLFKLQF